jgi:hypothetical protein
MAAMADACFDRAIALIDEANGEDLRRVTVDGVARPLEVVHAEMVSVWVRQLFVDPSDALLLAARAHHIRRWTRPRSDYPAGRRGYLHWRTALYAFQAAQARAVLEEAGCDEGTVRRVEALVAKALPLTDPEAAALEDALCLVFLQTQLDDLAARTEREKLIGILRKTARKMSDAGRAAAVALPLDERQRALLDAALVAD